MDDRFDAVTDRSGTNSMKWDVAEGELPMWVADMDFPAAPAVQKAIEKRAAHGIYGYSVLPDAWASAYADWWGKRHGFHMEKDWLLFCSGVIPAISSTLRRLTAPGENVVLQPPVYQIFYHSIENNGRRPLENPLVYERGRYRMDLEDLEGKLADPQTTLMILCNPHNPVGEVWDRETLARIGEMCARHHVKVISDEIHCDLTDPGSEYVPFASVSETCRNICVACLAPTKAFNLAGIQTAAVCVPGEGLRNRVRQALNVDEVAEPNAFAADAAIAAFTEGEDWLEGLRRYLWENKKAVGAFLREELPLVHLASGPATYLLWLDCTDVPHFGPDAAGRIRRATGLFLTAGGQYRGNGEKFLRLNVACPRKLLNDGLWRLKEGIQGIAGTGV